MSTDYKKDNKFTHNQELLSDKFEIVSYVLDDHVKEGHLFYEEPEEEFDSLAELKNYLYFRDEDASIPEHLHHTGDDGNGTVVLRAPTKFSWGVILGGLTLAFNLIVSGAAVYFYQSNLNSKILEKLEDLEAKVERIDDEKYDKTEDDLVRENLRLELRKHDEILNRIEGRYNK